MTALTARRRLGLVFIGGAVGTAIRAGLGLVSRAGLDADGVTGRAGAASVFPVTTFAINIVGAFLLGYLLERLISSGERMSDARSETLRLLVGTGVLGGFTTYSALAVDTVGLIGMDPVTALSYAGGTLVVGALASWAGILLGARRSGRRADGSRSTEGPDR